LPGQGAKVSTACAVVKSGSCDCRDSRQADRARACKVPSPKASCAGGAMTRRSRPKVRDGRSARERSAEAPPIDRSRLLAALQEEQAPLRLGPLLQRLQLPDDAAQRAAATSSLGELERAGLVLRNRRDEYLLVQRADLVVGRVQG